MNILAGIDIGATNVRHVLYGQKECKYLDYSIRTFMNCGSIEDEVHTNIINPLRDICIKNGMDNLALRGIGISLAAVFHRQSGNILKWGYHKKWENFSLLSYLKKHLGTEILLEDDANCAAVYEYSIRNMNSGSIIYITISTGIGCGIIVNGKLYKSQECPSGELGHIKIHNTKKLCSCGEYGCLQSEISGDGIMKTLIERHKRKGIYLNDAVKLEDIIKSEEFKPEILKVVLRGKSNLMSEVLITLKRLFGINDFVFGGGVVEGLPEFLTFIRQNIKNYDMEIRILPADNSKYNSAMGAVQILNHAGGKEHEQN